MKLPLALGVAFAALTVAAVAQTETNRIVIRHGAGHADVNFDANNDGWLSRDEASAGADRMFAEMDINDDGRLTSEDRPPARAFHFRGHAAPDIEIEDDGGERRVRVITRGGDVDEEEIERIIERAERHAEQAERQAERAEAQAERAAEQAERHAHRVEREVVIVRGDDDVDLVAPAAPVAPTPPVPPRPPMFMMLIANSDEADTNGDGGLSREEFRAQQLRFFDASDANNDRRIRFEAPPAPPEPPAPPAPPEPPRRNR
jgi:hypothetical protein